LSQTRLSTIELKTWLEKETGSILIPVQTQAQKHRDETRIALQNLTDACKIVLDVTQKEIDKKNMKVYNRARAFNKLAGLFVERIRKLKVPEQVSFDNISAFATETQKTLVVIEVDIRNWFPRISPFFIMDRRKFLTTFEKTKMAVNSLTDFTNKEYIKSKTLEKIFLQLQDLQTIEKQLQEIETSKANLSKERLNLEKEIIELEQRVVNLKENSCLKQATLLGTETETLNSGLKQMLNHLQKPFLKMQALAVSGGGAGVTPDELKTIELYMENPFEAVTNEQQGYPVLKQILEKLSNLMAEDKLKLKPDKQRKAEQLVAELSNSDSFEEYRRRSVEVASQRKMLLASSEIAEANRTLCLFEQQMEKMRVRKSSLEIDEQNREHQRQELLDRNNSLKKTIETNVLNSTGKQIMIN
jgi:hypothetical protein